LEKKTALNDHQVCALDGHALAKHYEALRGSVVNVGECRHTMVRGRALLAFKGMAAWMKAVGEAPLARAVPAGSRSELKLPGSVEQNLVDIVVTMALATAMEVTA
jgi:hypothetical protein